MPSSTPASQGYKGISFFSNQVQLAMHSSKAEMPTIQSGEGPNMLTRDTRWFLGSVLKMAKVLPWTLGCQSPRALMIVRMWRLLDFNSLSSNLGEPHLATCDSVNTSTCRLQIIHYSAPSSSPSFSLSSPSSSISTLTCSSPFYHPNHPCHYCRHCHQHRLSVSDLFKSLARNPSLLPDAVVRAVRSSDHVGEVEKPFGSGEVPEMWHFLWSKILGYTRNSNIFQIQIRMQMNIPGQISKTEVKANTLDVFLCSTVPETWVHDMMALYL